MAETYFDSRIGKLVVGETAVEAESAGTLMGDYDFDKPPTDTVNGTLRPLPELVTSEQFPFQPGEYGRDKMSNWSWQDLVNAATWASNIASQGGDDELRRAHLERLHTMMLVPEKQVFRDELGYIEDIRHEIGQNSYDTDYPNWTREQWADYSRRVDNWVNRNAESPRRPTHDDYNAAAKVLNGPSIWQVRNFGGVTKLNELNDRPDFTSMDAEQFLDWGVEVQRANDGQQLIRPVVDTLSGRGDGPSRKLIEKHFDSLTDFKNQVNDRFAEAEAHEAADRAAKLAEFDRIANELGFSATTNARENEMTDDMKISHVAQYHLAKDLLGSVDKSVLTTEGPRRVVQRLIERSKNTLTPGDIELRASLLGLMDDIWRNRPLKSRLSVSPTELRRGREKVRKDWSRYTGRNTGASPIASIGAVKAEIGIATDKSGESLDALQHAEATFEEAQDIFMRATQGSHQADVSEALARFADVQARINAIREQVLGAVAAAGSIAARL